jgi:hypothetical protein
MYSGYLILERKKARYLALVAADLAIFHLRIVGFRFLHRD